ncbi:MAG: type II toxin-antitoxin system HicB family antitoxin [Oligoflexia bacterium]|nr:type II toxin-antitoxin system HicB family antitoxin [Oligoflexia bacterium]
MKKAVFVPVVILRTKNGYSAHSPVINGCVATDKSIDSALKRFKEALEFHIEGEQLAEKKKFNYVKELKDILKKYEEDAFYASIKIAA